MPTLGVDGGAPPAEHGDDDELGELGEHGDDQRVQLVDLAAEEEPSWSYSTLKTLVSIPFMVAHVFAARRGPSDAWKPDDAELSVMVEPLHNMANRYARLRALARFGDPIAFASATSAYVGAEASRIDRWRTERADEPDRLVEDELAGLGVTGTREPSRAAADVRAWRPPNLPTES